MVADSPYSNEASATAGGHGLANQTGGSIIYVYDPFGNLVETTDAAGNKNSLSYDVRGRKVAMSDPDMGAWSYAYNALGELIRQTDAKSQVSSMQYDVLGRMTQRNEVGLNSSWTYDDCAMGVGKPCTAVSDNGYSRSHGCDSLGRPATLTVNIDTAYTTTTNYDGAGRVATITYPTGQFAVTNTYNTSHRTAIRAFGDEPKRRPPVS